MLLFRRMSVIVRPTIIALVILAFTTCGTPSRAATLELPGRAPAPQRGDAPLSRLRAAPMLRDLVARMADRSPAFARQCARIEATNGLYLRMRVDAPARHGRYVARTVIQRYEFGALVADVTLHSPPDLVETIAHEFEHVLEQVEGLDLHRLSLVKASGVTRDTAGDYETVRAVSMGRRVAAEYFAGGTDTVTAADY